MHKHPGPDFLCIGAPKCGTTWLYKHLSAHPQIWIPPVKELHYFDRRFPLPSAGEKTGLSKGLVGFFPRHSRRRIVRLFARSAVRASLTELRWAMRYLGGIETDEWYLSLFEPAGSRVAGELTTDYCALDAEGVQHVRALLPDVKIIFLMRNPIERAWSHAKMLLPELTHKPLSRISSQEFLDYLAHAGPRARGNYPRTLATWESAFPAERMFIGFFEDLSERPQTFLERIMQLLGVVPEGCFGLDLTEKVNQGSGARNGAVPDEIARALARHYLPDLEILSRRFGSHASTWLQDCQSILGQGNHRGDSAAAAREVIHVSDVRGSDAG